MKYIKKLSTDDFLEVAAIEKETYPEYFCFGYDDYVGFINKYKHNLSLGLYENEKMIGYIVAFSNDLKEGYVSDLVATNPFNVFPLLTVFGVMNKGMIFHAEFRENSYRLMDNLKYAFDKAVTWINEVVVENHFNSPEFIRKIHFKIEEEVTKNIRLMMVFQLFNTDCINNLDDIKNVLRNDYSFQQEEIERNEKWLKKFHKIKNERKNNVFA